MSSPQLDSPKGHSKNKSSVTKASRPRSSTKGPLDMDDNPLSSPISQGLTSPVPAQLSPNPNSTVRRTSQNKNDNPLASPISAVGEPRQKDFSFLLRPEIYHPLTPLNVPAAFRQPSKQPNPQATPEELLAKGHFRAAAIAAVQELTGAGTVDPRDAKRIFDLLYLRLACLTLIEATPLAAQEVKALEDLSSARTYIDEETGAHLVPWELRVLNVRLQAIGFSDPRRAVMSYHDLAREARAEIGKAASRHDNSAAETWKARLHDLGIKVASALIDMDDLTGAAHHLETLKSRGDGRLELSRALLWLQLGNADKARGCAAQGGLVDGVILALCDMAEGEFEAALSRWDELVEGEGKGDEMVSVNKAVCLLYLGRLTEGRDVLEGLVNSGLSSHTLLFNLCTMYELCTEKNKNLKVKLTERVAGLQESPLGWEKTNADFKL